MLECNWEHLTMLLKLCKLLLFDFLKPFTEFNHLLY